MSLSRETLRDGSSDLGSAPPGHHRPPGAVSPSTGGPRAGGRQDWLEPSAGPASANPTVQPDRVPPEPPATDSPSKEPPSKGNGGPASAGAPAALDHRRGRSPTQGAVQLNAAALDPIEVGPGDADAAPPMADQTWLEWLAVVDLNGRRVSDSALVLQDGGGGVAVGLADLEAWRVVVPANEIVTYREEPFAYLDGLGATDLVFDAASQSLAFDLAPDRLATTVVDAGPPAAPEPSGGWGAFLDYDLQYLAGDGVREALDGLFEAGAFTPHGVLLNSARVGDLFGSEAEVVRLETTFLRDLPGLRASLRLGDGLTAGGAFGRPVRFAGVQWATNFRTDPTFVSFPRPSIGGLAAQDSVVEVFVDNALRATEQVPSGPFEIDEVPAVTGAGEVQLKVTDLLGREQIVTQSFYVTPRLLKAGLSEYAYQLGALRENYGEESFEYGDGFLAATHRYGLTDALTLEGHGEALLDQQLAGVAASRLLGRFGLVSAGVAASAASGGPGSEAFMEYEYRGGRFGFGARSTLASRHFRRLGMRNDAPERVDQLNLGMRLDGIGRLGVLYVQSSGRGDLADTRTISTNFSRRIGPGTLILSAVHTMEPDSASALTAVYSLPLDSRRSTDATLQTNDGDARARVKYRGNRGASDLGLDYRIASEVGHDARRFDGSASYNGSIAGARLDAVERAGDTSVRAGLGGSVALLDGRVGLARRIGRSFGMVDLPGFADVPVRVDNRVVGRTNAAGQLVLPDLRPYETNRVSIHADDLPLDAGITNTTAVAVPYDRMGVTVDFGVTRTRHVVATLHDGEGRPLPAGLRLADSGGAFTGTVAKAGLAYFSGTPPSGAIELRSEQGHVCRLPELPDETLVDLGSLTCA